MNKSPVPSIPRLDGEPSNWYSRFVSFALAGPSRSALALYTSEKAAKPKKDHKGPPKCLPGAWKDAMTRWNWRERAAQYDLETIEIEREQQKALRESERRKRLDLLRMFRRKIASALRTLNVGTASLAQIAAAVRVLGAESREELELVELAARLDELERANPSNDELLDGEQRRFRDEMRRRFGGPTDDVDAA